MTSLPFDPTSPRERVEPQKRKPLSRREFAELILRQEGRCGCGCGERLKADEIVDEHLHALALGGGNELTNRSLWRKQCSQKKTDEIDKPASAKTKRLNGETSSQRTRRERNGPQIVSRNSLQSRGFDKSLRKRMNGKVERR